MQPVTDGKNSHFTGISPEAHLWQDSHSLFICTRNVHKLFYMVPLVYAINHPVIRVG